MTQDSTQHFIVTIEADRDKRIEQIQAAAAAEIKQICGEAHERSRRLQHDTNARLRNELASRRQKETSRIQAHLRRQLWQNIKQLQHDLKQQVLERAQQAWREPAWQWDWCRFWLDSIDCDDARADIRVEIDQSADPDTPEQDQPLGGRQ